MEYLVLLIAIVSFPLVLGVFFRVSASALFFSIMAGELLARFFHVEAERALKVMIGESASHYGEALILLIPVLLTAIVMRKTLPRTRLILSIIPLMIAGIVLAVFLLPILPAELQASLQNNQYAKIILELNSAFVGIIILSHLVLMWVFDRNEHKGKRRRKKD